LTRTTGDPGLVNTRDLGAFPGAVTPVVDPAIPTGLPGSPLNTLYGVDSESYLTEDQKKLARQIQGKFDASLNSRDRALQQYGAPRLSSFVEDEALARAMSLARGLNFPTDALTEDLTTPGGVRAAAAPRVAAPRPAPGPPPAAPGPPSPSTFARAQQILAGLASIIPLLFGKDAYGNFLNKGAIGWLKEQLFPGTQLSDEALEKIVNAQGLPTNGGVDAFNTAAGTNWSDAYGPGSNWGGVPDASLDAGNPWADWTGESGYGDWTLPDTSGWDFGALAGP
jgi:hypothetical protein